MSSLGERMKYLRDRKKLTLDQLALQLSIPVYDKEKIVNHKPVTSGTISNLENNKHRPHVDLISVIAKFFDVSLEWLVNGKEFLGEKTPSLEQLKLKDMFAKMTPEELEEHQNILTEMREQASLNRSE